MSSSGDWALRPSETLPALHIDREVSLTRPATIKAYDYWRARRGDRIMPARKDIRPGDMRQFLAHVALIEIRKTDTDYQFVVRLAGTQVEEFFGPVTGKAFSEFLSPPLLDRWNVVYAEALRTRGPLKVSGQVFYKGRRWLEMETFIGPLSGDDGEISQFFLGFVTWPIPAGDPSQTPA